MGYEESARAGKSGRCDKDSGPPIVQERAGKSNEGKTAKFKIKGVGFLSKNTLGKQGSPLLKQLTGQLDLGEEVKISKNISRGEGILGKGTFKAVSETEKALNRGR